MFKRLDRSPFLMKFLTRMSDLLSRQRGLPVVVGIVLVVVGTTVQAINVPVDNDILALLGVLISGVGILIALIGLLLATPLGK